MLLVLFSGEHVVGQAKGHLPPAFLQYEARAFQSAAANQHVSIGSLERNPLHQRLDIFAARPHPFSGERAVDGPDMD